MTEQPPRPWFLITDLAFLYWLRRAARGESPDLLLAEAYANADHRPTGETPWGHA